MASATKAPRRGFEPPARCDTKAPRSTIRAVARGAILRRRLSAFRDQGAASERMPLRVLTHLGAHRKFNTTYRSKASRRAGGRIRAARALHRPDVESPRRFEPPPRQTHPGQRAVVAAERRAPARSRDMVLRFLTGMTFEYNTKGTYSGSISLRERPLERKGAVRHTPVRRAWVVRRRVRSTLLGERLDGVRGHERAWSPHNLT